MHNYEVIDKHYILIGRLNLLKGTYHTRLKSEKNRLIEKEMLRHFKFLPTIENLTRYSKPECVKSHQEKKRGDQNFETKNNKKCVKGRSMTYEKGGSSDSV